MTDVLPFPGPAKGPCEGNQDACSSDGCPLYGKLGKLDKDGKRRHRDCSDAVGAGRANGRLGRKGQRRAARTFGVPLAGTGPGNEEDWRAPVRIEAKAGAQAGPVLTRYLRARAQSDEARSIGDHRPFVYVAGPPRDEPAGLQLVVVSTADLREVVEVLYHHWNPPPGAPA